MTIRAMPRSRTTTAAKAGSFKAAIDIYMHGLIAKTQETQQGAVDLLCRNCRRGDLRRRHAFVLREPRAHRQPARSRLEFPEALVVAGDESAPQAGGGRLLLHARIELLLSVAAFQPEAPDPDQEAGARDEEGAERNGSRPGGGGWRGSKSILICDFRFAIDRFGKIGFGEDAKPPGTN